MEGSEISRVHDFMGITTSILDGYALPIDGYHGIVHWARVYENGMRIARENGGDIEVVSVFALFHDSRRVNEHRDDDHGLRGAELARTLRGTLVHLDDEQFEMLFEACRLHTEGTTTEDPTIQACWDADRLDLGRVGITPRAERLCSDYARQLIAWADARAVVDYCPHHVLESWGVSYRSLPSLRKKSPPA